MREDTTCENLLPASATLVHLLDEGAPSHPAIRVPNGPSITYDSLRSQVCFLAGQLNSLGLGHGDRVAIVLPNGLESIISFLAVTAAGATAASLNPAATADEFRFYLEDIDPRALITPSQEGQEAREAAPASTIKIGASVDTDGQVSFSIPETHASPSPAGHPSPDHVALTLHTSGTTSRPKRVPLTHENLAISARNVVETYELTADDVSLCIMPLFHIHGLVASTLATFLSGGTVVLPARFSPLKFWPMVQEYEVTWFSAVPAMHLVLVNRARGKRGSGSTPDSYRGLRFIRSCSASLPAATLAEMEELFGAPVLEAYGMTEAAHQMTSNPLPQDGERMPGSVGRPLGVSIAVMNKDGKILPPGARGEVVIQGPTVIQGYENNPEANATSFTDGWFRTGDEGIIDFEGYLTLVGRLKELINYNGEKVSPSEIDEVLLAHPSVAEAVAFGLPHPIHGEEPCAVVVLRAPATQASLVAHCRERLTAFKCPKVIHIVDEIPKTATGKVQRRVVAAAFSGRSTVSSKTNELAGAVADSE